MTSRTLALAIGLALSTMLAGCGGSGEQAAAPAVPVAPAVDPAQLAAEMETLYGQFWEESLQLNPIQATFIGDNR